MAYRIFKENGMLNGKNKELELENARLRGTIEEQVRNMESLEKKNAARIASLEELNRQAKEERNLQFTKLRSSFNEYEEKLVCCQVFQRYARVTISFSTKRY